MYRGRVRITYSHLKKIIVFIFNWHSWLCWVFTAARGLSLLSVRGGVVHLSRFWVQASQFRGFSCCRAQAPGMRASPGAVPGLQSTGAEAVAYGLSWSSACGIFSDQGSNLSLLHWQEDSLPLSHQGSPNIYSFLKVKFIRSCLWSNIYDLLPMSQGTKMIIGDN